MRRVAIYYDTLVSKGGAERVIIELANALHADIITSGFNPSLEEWMPIKTRVIDIGNYSIKINKTLGVLFEAPIRFFLHRRFAYDVHIYAGFTSIFGAKKNNSNIWYCFTPNRTLYDMRLQRLKEGSFLRHCVVRIYLLLFYRWDQHVIQNYFPTIISQSETIQQRVKTYYNKPSRVIHSPLDTSKYYFKTFGNFFLAVSRLYPEKRMDMIAEAFLHMKDKKLILVGGGPEKEKIERKIADSYNIKLYTDLPEEKLLQLYATCIATIYMPVNEDYGLIPLEGMSSGKPCIGVNEGGVKETIINNKVGYLINPTVENIIQAVKKLDKKKLDTMKNDCIKRAKMYDIQQIQRLWKMLL